MSALCDVLVSQLDRLRNDLAEVQRVVVSEPVREEKACARAGEIGPEMLVR